MPNLQVCLDFKMHTLNTLISSGILPAHILNIKWKFIPTFKLLNVCLISLGSGGHCGAVPQQEYCFHCEKERLQFSVQRSSNFQR